MERTYIAIDLNNAEGKEMPIQLRNTENKRAIPQSIGTAPNTVDSHGIANVQVGFKCPTRPMNVRGHTLV